LEGLPALPRPLPESQIALRGRVIGTEPNSTAEQANPRLEVWVNGFPQVLAPLTPSVIGSGERTFRAEVLLSREKDNQIELKLGGAPLDVLGEHKFLASCRKVEANWRLHLLVMGIGAVDQNELRDRAIAALKGRLLNADEGTFETPAFPSATLYGLDRADIDGPWLIYWLGEISKAIALGPIPSNDVVILYYQGGEVIDVKGQEPCLRLRPGAGMTENDVIRLSEIREGLDKTRGAKLFLLDVTHDAPDQAPLMLVQAGQWIENELPFGLLRFSSQEQRATPDASFATTLKAALQKNNTLGKASEEVGRQSRLLKVRYTTLQYLPVFNRYFDNLILSGP
jgi:hypothetical protein